MRPILVTGAQGFLGRAFVAAALAAGERVVGFGRSQRCDDAFSYRIRVRGELISAPLPREFSAALDSSKYEYCCGDILDGDSLASLIERTQPRAVVHLAAALRDAEVADLQQTNVGGTEALFDAIDRSDAEVACVVLGSSGLVYGRPNELPLSEESPCEPFETYGTTKLAAERIAAARAKPQVRMVNARIFNLVGPGQDGRHACGRFAEQVAAFDGKENVLHLGDLRPTRDYIDVRDAASGILRMLSDGYGSYNVCSCVETPIQTILDMTLHAAGANGNVKIEQSYRRDADIPRQVGSNAKLRSIGWEQQYSLERSIADLVEYYRSIG